MRVQKLMTTPVVTVPADASLERAVERMLTERVGSVVLTHDGDPTGILTETDAMHAGVVTDRPFAAIEVRAVASSSLETISPETTVRAAVEQMQRNDVKKLPVVERLELVGLLTVTDIVYAYSDIVSETVDAADRRNRWETDSDRWRLDGR
ncbi:MAG: putative signal-transduction protein [halophilic archaeon J07HB67]|jgi:Predicted signal-transduction protein containing cAMP-binding and CBS domains|nr:MAG: putative signal-transduction protein [halophilic archaeon J07HB67]